MARTLRQELDDCSEKTQTTERDESRMSEEIDSLQDRVRRGELQLSQARGVQDEIAKVQKYASIFGLLTTQTNSATMGD
jgi:hypothetical protein